MSVYPIAAAVFAALTVGAAIGWWRLRNLQRVIRLERATARLTEAAHHRDTEAFKRRIRAAVAEHQAAEDRDRILSEAEQIVTAEYARTTRHNPQEGDTP
ncbi:hypothetical protein [Streptomyces sp. NBC_01435]|uniref:hypothetical protein n=1 Tax=Streptomyces sp. NBC_01435 TaxID=2903865 RepID=UPI002E33FB4D|nr:hypothetical protein [Streptomyces sp. NBC_01435]